jgi:UDPglucose 6-dehydrogenase
MKITVVGAGYVGTSIAMLLAQNNEVVILDNDIEKVEKLGMKISPITDADVQNFLSNKNLKFYATSDKNLAYINAEFIIVAVPTDYDSSTNYFNTATVESVIKDITDISPDSTIIIKSTVPVGFTSRIKNKLNNNNIIFSPEFLREGSALHDNLFPSRIILGEVSKKSKRFSELLIEGAIKEEIDILFTNSSEAEAIKLFSNTYLAMRISFFNELDTYAELNGLNSKNLINGIGLDPRIGSHYNNPSFGYGGYCLPKDTKQLKANFKDVPHALITAIVESNSIRKNFITSSILSKKPKTVGVYRLIMKSNSDNFRSSAVHGIIERLQAAGINIIIYEPSLEGSNFLNFKILKDIKDFKNKSDLIITNRMDEEISDVLDKVYTRDIFNIG